MLTISVRGIEDIGTLRVSNGIEKVEAFKDFLHQSLFLSIPTLTDHIVVSDCPLISRTVESIYNKIELTLKCCHFLFDNIRLFLIIEGWSTSWLRSSELS